MERKIDVGTFITYPLLMGVVYLLSGYSLTEAYVKPFLLSMEAFLGALFAGAVMEGFEETKRVSGPVKGLGVVLFTYLLPEEVLPFSLHDPLAFLALGVWVASLAPKLPLRASFVVRGVGVFTALYALSTVEQLALFADAFIYAGIAVLVAYTAVTLEHEGIIPGHFVERNLVAIALVAGTVGLYLDVRPYAKENFPELVFYVDWGLLALAVILAALALYANFSKENLENYLVGEWRKHESSVQIRADEEFETAKKAIEDFVVRKKKAPLLTFLTLYGGRVMGREAVLELIEPIAEYGEEPISPFTPGWLKRRHEKAMLEKRVKLVEEALRKLE
ncbi:hypothetical protein [Palaeococcus ferrophilus]|uniref:hypothetical protein n=1 Tax=Palaeococcus ferrophilus TaxID=83868 RepID=UPI00064EA2F9|nr:hypothetical protein [Palaeococcus ferrophilus]